MWEGKKKGKSEGEREGRKKGFSFHSWGTLLKYIKLVRLQNMCSRVTPTPAELEFLGATGGQINTGDSN